MNDRPLWVRRWNTVPTRQRLQNPVLAFYEPPALKTTGRQSLVGIIGKDKNGEGLVLGSDQLDQLPPRPRPLNPKNVDTHSQFGKAGQNTFHQGATPTVVSQIRKGRINEAGFDNDEPIAMHRSWIC